MENANLAFHTSPNMNKPIDHTIIQMTDCLITLNTNVKGIFPFIYIEDFITKSSSLRNQ